MSHEYTSTACHHERHQECRFSCKFCDAICQCLCHSSVNKFWNWPASDNATQAFKLTIINEAFDALGYTEEWAKREVS